MTAHPPPSPDGVQAPDLAYDLAHEAADHPGGCPPTSTGSGPTTLVQVCTRTSDYDGDYGYDLAHDIPRPQRP